MGELVVVLVVLITAIAAHELAHLGVARLVGHQVFELQIGGGPTWETTVRGVDVRVGVVPIGGHVQTGARDGEGFRWRSAVVAGSGVGANLVLAGAGAVAGIGPMIVFNVLAAAANLWPGRRRRLGEPSSDGRTLLDLALGNRDAIAEERSGWYCVEAGRAREAGDVAHARRLVDRGIAELGPTRALLAVRGVIAFEERRFADVVDAYAHLIDDDRVTVAGRAGFAADAAWAASLSGDPDLARLAEPWAAFARRVRPRSPRRRMVHALALVDDGDNDGAARALEGIDDTSADAIRSLALLSGGDEDAARMVFDTRVVPGLAPDHPLRERLARALAADSS
ncbi:MAG: site-2 protease family protein [Acidimicrobiales bacterium]|nr:site-2 protease family protein [Acidimicrobiales bacterium]